MRFLVEAVNAQLIVVLHQHHVYSVRAERSLPARQRVSVQRLHSPHPKLDVPASLFQTHAAVCFGGS